jgi:predicted anti-sigma-YlaC factor YlaD
MNCKYFHKRIPSFLESSISQKTKTLMVDHLESCEACRTIIKEVNSTMEFSNFKKVNEVSPFFYSAIEARIVNQASSVSYYLPKWGVMLSAVTIAASIFLGIMLFNQIPVFNSSDILNTAYSSEDPIVSDLSLTELNTPASLYYEMFNADQNEK